jgi:FkbM family methyltransferase
LRIAEHISRARFQLGRKMVIGPSRYKLRGYHGSNFTLNTRDNERDVLAVLQRHLSNRTGAFLDVGVNIGQTLYKVLSVDPQREYYGFEPQVSCCDDVARFAALNRLSNVHVLPVALSNENGTATFYARDMTDCMASLLPQEGATKSLIQVRKGDELIEELGIGEIAIIKVDVEGAEWQVFDGLRKTLNGRQPMLLFEVLPNFTGSERSRVSDEEAQSNRERLGKLEQVLRDCGYRISRVHADGREELIERIDLDDTESYVGNNYTAAPYTRGRGSTK